MRNVPSLCMDDGMIRRIETGYREQVRLHRPSIFEPAFFSMFLVLRSLFDCYQFVESDLLELVVARVSFRSSFKPSGLSERGLVG